MKAQIAISSQKQILCTNICKGKNHDFDLFKDSKLPINIKLKLYVDSGYQGVLKFHKCSELPKKSSKHNPLSYEDKLSNREKAKIRIIVEHVNAKLKVFKIFSTQYRNRRKDFLKRFNIVCALVNADMGF